MEAASVIESARGESARGGGSESGLNTSVAASEDKASRQARKEEAKKLKRKRIEEGGGMRPRQPNPSSSSSSSSKKRSRPKARHTERQNPKSASSASASRGRHRFGGVMEQPPCPEQPRSSTLAMAVPGSVVSNAQTQELRTRLVGQIARAAAVFHVDEVVVFDDNLADRIRVRGQRHGRERPAAAGEGAVGSADPHAFMARILQYCECPQYLRKRFFPVHPDLQFAGLLPPIDAPHHVRVLDRTPFREGVVLDKKLSRAADAHADADADADADPDANNSLVHCGIRGRDVEIDRKLPPGIRCTVQIDRTAYTTPGKKMRGTVVSPNKPREQNGTYWGYTTRIAPSLSAIFEQSPYPGGYDLKIGTSERGDVTVDDHDFHKHFTQYTAAEHDAEGTTQPSNFKHAIIVFGGVAGIEECVDADETLTLSGSDSRSLFHLWVNTCPYQGSRTIRTEEAVWLSLARLRPHLFPMNMGKGAGIDVAAPLSTHTKTNTVAKTVEFSDSAPSEESSDEGER